MIALGKILVLGFVVGVVSGLGKTLPHAGFFRWNGSPLIRCIGAIILLGGIPASVCVLTRRARSAWVTVLILVGAMLIAPWVDIWSDRFKTGRYFTRSLDSMVWEPLVLAAIMVIPLLLMRRFIPAFKHHEAVP